MDLQFTASRVPISAGTSSEGVPVEIGPAPVETTGLDSDQASLRESNERSSLNLNRREALDSEDERPKQLFRCKTQTILSTPAF